MKESKTLSSMEGEIMIVDDTAANVELLTDILGAAGYRVRAASDGSPALQNARANPPALILLGIKMPGMDGYEVCRRLKEDEITNSCVVIFIGVLGEESEKVKGFEAGGVDYITWPFQPREVLAKINTHLTLWSFRQNLEHRNAELESSNLALVKEIEPRKRVEKELAMEKECLAVILHSIRDGVISTDTEGRITALNKQAEALTGWTEVEALGRPLQEVFVIVSEKSGKPGENPVKRVLNTGEIIDLANRTVLMAKDGTRRMLSHRGAPIRSEDGEALGVVLVFSDVTERVRTEKELKKSEALLKEAQRVAHIGHWELKDMAGPPIWSEEIFHILGLDPSQGEPSFASLRNATYPEDWALLSESMRTLNREGVSFDIEFRLLHTDGSLRWMNVKGHPRRNAQGDIVRLFGTVQDITGRKHAEHALEQSEKQFRLMYEEAPMPYQSLDEQGRLCQVNSAWLDMLGYTREEVIGRNFSDFLSPASQELFNEKFPVFKRAGQVYGLLYEMVRKDRSVIDVSIDGRVSASPGPASWRSHCVFQDVTRRKRAEEALNQSRKSFASIVEKSADGILVLGSDGEVLYANPSAIDLLGYDEVFLKQATFGTPIVNVEDATLHIVRPDGKIRDVEIRTTAIDWFGRNALMVMLRDMTEQQRYEQALRQEKELTEKYLNVAGVMFVILDRNGRVVRVNRKTCEVLGRENNDLLGRDWITAVMPVEARDDFREVLDHLMAGQITPYEYVEASILTGTGETRLISWHNALLKDENGSVIGAVSSGEDITERKEMENRLAESEMRYRLLFERSIDSVLIVRPDGELITANSTTATLLGVEVDELTSLNIKEFLRNPDDWARFRSEIEEHGFVKDYPLEQIQEDGTEKLCLLSSSLWKDRDGAVIGYLSIIRDITESLKLEEQLRQAQKMESIGTLAGGIAHDFNNILTIIQGYSEMLLGDKSQNHIDFADLSAVHGAARRGAELVKQLLTFSRRVETEFRPVNLNQEVQTATKLLSRTIPKMIDMRLSLADNLNRINADPGQMEQIILNLAVNAKDAMPQGGTLTFVTGNTTLDEEYCRTQPEASPGYHIFLQIKDTGRGMSKEVMQRIFEPFYSTKKQGEGTGLGLAMVYGIVKNHGGHVTCHSEPGVGTTFTIYFPVIEVTSLDHKMETETLPTGGSETILLVDDEEMVRSLGTKMLERAGYSVLTAQNGEEALALYGNYGKKVNLVLLDLIMPGMGGYQALERLKTMDPDIRVVIASGYSPDGLLKASTESGAVGFVGKPFNRTDLLSTVRTALDR